MKLNEIVNSLYKGFFKYNSEKLGFSVSKIDETVSVGEVFQGSFRMESRTGGTVSGRIFTSSMRLVCMCDEFECSSLEVKFGFDSTGLEPGDIVKGDIQIVSDAGEYYIPFVFSIVRGIVEGSIGTVRNLFHFANQAQADFKEAVRLFYSPQFLQIFEGNDRIYLDKYRAYSNVMMDEENVDEFLVAIRKKPPIVYRTDKSVYEFEDITETLRVEIPVTKSTWGYVSLKIDTDADFLWTEKSSVSDDDFLGNVFTLSVFIREDFLHEGKNFGKIILSNERTKLEIVIAASRRRAVDEKRTARREMNNLTHRLMLQYIAFRTRRINVNTWSRESMKIVERMNALDDKNPVSRMFQAQLLIVQKRENEAKWILEHVEHEMQIDNQGETVYCYYLYLMTLTNRSESYIDETADKVAKIFSKNKDFRILWVLLYLDSELSQGSSKKLGLLQEQYGLGCRSPIMYIEAYNYYIANPAAINKLGDFELQVLLWSVRNGQMEKGILDQLLYQASREKHCNDTLIRILALSYKILPEMEIVSTICTLLIKGNRTDEKYFQWYKLGVQYDLKITRLYEYYMYSVPMDYKELISKHVILYFGFNNQMDYERMAFLYANLIAHKLEDPSLYEAYREHMQVFAIEQIEQEHVNRDLAEIYEDVLFVQLISPAIAGHFSRILFANELKVPSEKYVRVVTIHEELKQEVSYPVIRGYAYPVIYTQNCSLFYEDSHGNRVPVTDERPRRMIDDSVYVSLIQNYVNDNPGFALYVVNNRRQYVIIDEDNVDICRYLVESDEISESYKHDIRMALMHYYYDSNQTSTLDEFLMVLDPKILHSKDRAELITFYVRRGMYEKAYETLTIFGIQEVPAKTLVRICSHMISRNEEIPDPMLCKVTYQAFANGKYDVLTLKYLVENFEGLTKELRNLWRAAVEFEVECDRLIEKLMIQLLYTRTTIGEKEELFEQYIRNGANTKVELAFLSYHAYEYFAKERLLGGYIIDHLVRNYKRGEELNDACKLAMLKYYSEVKGYGEAVKDMLTEFLLYFLHKNIFFKFFMAFDGILPELQMYDDKTVIEYRTDPEHKVMLHYIIESPENAEDEYHTEEMLNMYGGIFSREFILFFGENLQYYITEEAGGSEKLTASDSVTISDAVSKDMASRYCLINDMVVSKTLQDDSTLIKLMEEYVEADSFTEKVFTVL